VSDDAEENVNGEDDGEGGHEEHSDKSSHTSTKRSSNKQLVNIVDLIAEERDYLILDFANDLQYLLFYSPIRNQSKKNFTKI
jgi:hypothetical protein